MASTLGETNPLRYRGYVYDNETGMYYLQSRYYDPELGRFLNADAFASTGQGILGYNMFAYCLNNAPNRTDSNGLFSADYYSDDSDLFDRMLEGASAGLGVVMGVAVGIAIHEANKKKPINLPSHKKLTLDIDHITSGHMPNGPRNPNGKKDVFWGMTTHQVIKAIYEAYQHSSKLQTQGNNVRLLGYSTSFNIWIEMWVDIVDYIIKTAYPKG